MQSYDGFPGLRLLTANVRNRCPSFSDIPGSAGRFIENLNFYGEKYHTIYCGWVLMPDHYHLLMYLAPCFKLSDFERDFQSMIARQVIDSRKEERDWHSLLSFKSINSVTRRREATYQFWQGKAHVVPIGNIEQASIKLRYIHQNPVRAGLVERAEDWPYSSARWYEAGEGPVLRMMRTEVFFEKWYGWRGPRNLGGEPIVRITKVPSA